MQYALLKGMTLLGRLFAAAGISLALTLLLLVIFQVDGGSMTNDAAETAQPVTTMSGDAPESAGAKPTAPIGLR
jgi:hypothetical protein